MKPLITIQFDALGTDRSRIAAPIMAETLEAIAAAIRSGEDGGRIGKASWAIETEITLGKIKRLLDEAERRRQRH